jgi:hypothetical protein
MEPQRSQIFSFQRGCSLKNIAGYDIHLKHFCRSKVGPNHIIANLYHTSKTHAPRVHGLHCHRRMQPQFSVTFFKRVIFSFSFSFLTLFPSYCLQKTAKSCCTYRTGSRTLFFKNFKETPLSRKIQRVK